MLFFFFIRVDFCPPPPFTTCLHVYFIYVCKHIEIYVYLIVGYFLCKWFAEPALIGFGKFGEILGNFLIPTSIHISVGKVYVDRWEI